MVTTFKKHECTVIFGGHVMYYDDRMVVYGTEVPFLSNDSVNWVEISVPSCVGDNNGSQPAAPFTQDYASNSFIDTPSTYLIWRIFKRQPHAIEILEVPVDGEIPRVGLRILFPETLFPFAYICKNKTTSAYGSAYLLYALSIFGTAYLLQLKNISTYDSSYVIQPKDDFLHFDTKISTDCPPITAAIATSDGLVIGRNDGTLRYFRLGNWYDDAPVLIHELRNVPVGCLKNVRTRSLPGKSVKELVISKINGRNFLFVLHSGSKSCLRIWDISDSIKLVKQMSLIFEGTKVSRLCVEVDANAYQIRLIYLVTQESYYREQIAHHILNFPPKGRISSNKSTLVGPRFGMKFVYRSQAKVINMKLSSNKIWILHEEGLWKLDLSLNVKQYYFRYSLQETFISKQLLQDSNSSFDAFYQTTRSLFSSKEQMIGFISSIFLHRVLQPGVYICSVLRVTFEDYNKHWTDHEFQALTFDEIRREILLLIQHEAISGSVLSVLNCWKNFCSRYFKWWCKSSAPLSLLAGGGVGLIRQNSVSLLRSLGDSEFLMHGSNFEVVQDGKNNINQGVSIFPYKNIELLVIRRLFGCITILNQHFGPLISPGIFYELSGGARLKSTEDGIHYLLKAIKCGLNNTSGSDVALPLRVSELLGADFDWHKGLAHDRFGLSEFSFCMLHSVIDLLKKANEWSMILNVLKTFMSFLVPQTLKPSEENLGSDMAFLNTKIPIIVQATSQVAGLMFESALNILLFLCYLLDISGQVEMLPDDKSRIQLELIPMINDIIVQWLIIHFFSTMPLDSRPAEHLSSQLSSLRIGNFTLASVLFLDAHEGLSYRSLSSLPNPESISNWVRQFICWICRRSKEKPLYGFQETTELTLSLLRHGQYNAVEMLLMILDVHSRCKKLYGNYTDSTEGDVLHHLLECCLLAQSKVEHIDLQKIIMSLKRCVTCSGAQYFLC